MRWERSDGAIVDSARRAVAEDARSGHASSRFFHHGCVAPSEAPREP